MAWAAAVAAGGAQAIAAYKKSKAHEAQAEEYVEAKNRRMGAATREVEEEERKADFIQSRATAVAAASGAGTDGSFVKVLGDLAAEGKYRVMSVLWSGLNDAQGLLARAEAEKQAAKDALVMGAVNAVTSAVSAYAGAGGFSGAAPTGSVIPSATDLSGNRAAFGGTGDMGFSSQGLPYSPTPGGKPTLWKG